MRAIRFRFSAALVLLLATQAAAQLTVTTLSPARHDNVAANAVVSITFDRAVDTATVTNDSFRVFGRNSGPANGTISFTNSDQTIVLTPAASFAAGETVTVTLANTLVADDASTFRPEGYSYQFGIETAAANLAFTEIDKFSNRNPPSTQTRIYGALAADLNDDGYTDLMTVNEVSADIRVFMNLANGTGLYDTNFLPPQAIGVESSPNDAGDFDNDGDVDAAISAAVSDTVSIALGANNGMFAITQVTVGDESHGVAVLDADGDGDPDVANANHDDNMLGLMLNNGMGVFAGPVFFDGGVNGEYGLAAGDMNNDGIIDLVTCSDTGQVRTSLSLGNGMFTQAAAQTTGQCWVVVLGDVNGDGDLDAVTADTFDGTGSILLGNGDGTFAARTTVSSGGHTPSADLGDLDGDGDLDLVLSVFGGGFWRVYTNDGSGSFSQVQQIEADANPSCSVLLDFDNDGDLDMALTDEIADNVTLMKNSNTAPPPACPPAPATCAAPFVNGKALLIVKDNAVSDTADKVIWKWLFGTQTEPMDFGDPLTSDGYRLCVYDSGGLELELSAAAGDLCGTRPCWRATSSGFVYKNSDTTIDGAHVMILRAGADGKAKIIVKGRGDNLDMPALGTLSSPVSVRLHKTTGTECWGATYTMPFLKQDATVFKDRAD